MSVAWGDLNARARGLARHLVEPEVMRQLADAPDLVAFVRVARAAGLVAPDASAESVLEVELALRRTAARQLRLLLRWVGDRAPLVRIVVEDEDRRSVRAILRGAAAGAASEARLAGLVPTPSLPERLLEELAAQPTPREVAALLAAWGHPFGPAALGAASVEHPDLFRFEVEIDRVFAARAAAGARRGGPVLRAFVADTIDYANVRAALVLAAGESEQPAGAAFLPGGRRFARERFLEAAAAGPDAASKLATALAPDEVSAVVRRTAGDAGALERELLALRIRRLRDLARTDPLGSAPLLAYFLRLRAEQENLRLLLWGAALGAPGPLRRDRLVPSA